MFEWLKRLFRIGIAEANSAIDKLEDPVKMTEQGIKDLKTDLNKSLQALAEVKASAIRSKKDLEKAKLNAANYEQKAVALLKKAQAGEIDPAEADRLAERALQKKDQLVNQVNASSKNTAMLDEQVAKMESNVNRLKSQISTWENELKTLKARSKVSEASKNLHKQLANIDSSGTVAMLEKMKEKVSEQEALAQSYADMNDAAVTEDEEIDRALGMGSGSATAHIEASDALLKLKAKLADSGGDDSSSSSSSSSSASSSSSTGGDSSGGGMSELDKLKQQLKDKDNG